MPSSEASLSPPPSLAVNAEEDSRMPVVDHRSALRERYEILLQELDEERRRRSPNERAIARLQHQKRRLETELEALKSGTAARPLRRDE